MTTSETSFNGVRVARLDSSLRLCIPADWRGLAEDVLYLFFSRNKGHPIIKVVTRSFYDERMEMILRQDSHDKARLAARLESLTRKVRPDKRNRIAIPWDLGELLGLEKSGTVTLVGCGKHFEIWRPEEFESFLEQECSREIFADEAQSVVAASRSNFIR